MVSSIDHPIALGTLIFIGSDGLQTIAVPVAKAELQVILQRALNTWSDAPQKLMQFSDNLDRL